MTGATNCVQMPALSGQWTTDGDQRKRKGPIGGVATARVHQARDHLSVGTRIAGRWELLRPLGQGAFGQVYEALDLTLNEHCAVKLLGTDGRTDDGRLDRFRQEARTLRALSGNRFILAIWDYCEQASGFGALLAMELVSGPRLADLIASGRGQTPVELATSVYTQVLLALDIAHDHGVIHGDVTPTNVLLSGGSTDELLASPQSDPAVKLCDFGCARLAGPELHYSIHAAAGTIGYAAPEMFHEDGRITDRADVYGAAAATYELLVGSIPMARFPDPRSIRPEIPPPLEALLLDSLGVDAATRPSAREALDRLQESKLQRRRSSYSVISPSVRAGPRMRPGREHRPTRPPARKSPRRIHVEIPPSSSSSTDTPRIGPRRETSEQHEASVQLGVPVAVRHVATGLPLTLVPGGEFVMGLSDVSGTLRGPEAPAHRVTVEPFYLGDAPVPVGVWEAWMPALEAPGTGDDSRPVVAVNRADAHDFLRRVSLPGCHMQLPTEAQWEYAAGLDEGGIETLGGGLWEWVADAWHPDYRDAPDDGSAWTSRQPSVFGVLRGGRRRGTGGDLITTRGCLEAETRFSIVGLRVACAVSATGLESAI